MTKKNIFGLALFFGTWAILAAIFAVYDLQISLAVYNPDSGWANFMDAYGQVPGILLAALGANVLVRLRNWDKSIKNIVISILVYLYTALLSMSLWVDLLGFQAHNDTSIMPKALGLGIVTMIVLQIWLRRYSAETLRRFEKPAKIVVWMSLLSSLVTVWTFKIAWGRVTFGDLASDFSNFTPWYLPQGNTGHHSFFSGHTSFAWLLLPVTLLIPKEKPTLGAVVWAVVIIWGVLAAASRVVIGAHFASDVLFGAAQTVLWFLILKRLIMKPSPSAVGSSDA